MSFKNLDVQTATAFLKNSKGFDHVLEKVKFISIGDGKCSAELIVDESCVNWFSGLHGGFSATLIDVISTFALCSQTGTPGVSTDIHLTYLKGVKLGDTILINGKVVRTGRNLAFLEAEICNKETGEVAVKGSQTQFVAK